VYPGDKVRVTVGNQSKEFTVKGIIDSKIDFVGLSVYMPEKEFRRLFKRDDQNADDMVLRLTPEAHETALKAKLVNAGIHKLGKIQTFTESIPKYIDDVKDTFNLLGLVIGIIGITVASITVFIIIFINILMRRRQIGILKAIGISRKAIHYTYMIQALFYASVGSLIGVCVVLFIFVPYFQTHPIDFPYSDVSLQTTSMGLLVRVGALSVVIVIAGFFPAWLITRQNTLSAILGRK
jgi:putative ABC transport system permease protein